MSNTGNTGGAQWTEVRISVASGDIDSASAIAHMTVPYGIYIEDYSDLEQGVTDIARIAPGSGLIDDDLLSRDRTRGIIHLYLSPELSSGTPAEAVAFLGERLNAAGIVHETDTGLINEDDWANNWKKYFLPLETGDRLLICPTWTAPPPAKGRALLRIDPGMAFGTGGHDTTRLVLETMERYVSGGCKALDIGCGSGILSIAALLLGAESVLGIDIDPVAVRTAKENGAINGMASPAYIMRQGDLVSGIEDGCTYDIITANIVADAIIALSPDVPRLLAPGGAYIVSGIIDGRGREVSAALEEQGFAVREYIQSGGWVCIVLTRPDKQAC